MIDREVQRAKAERLRASHHGPRLLVLPNIWDPLGARMLERMGFPAVATASAAVAWSLGRDDGESLDFGTVLDVVRRIAASVELPLSADIERGYADGLDDLAANARAVVAAGAVGINIEDSFVEGGALRDVGEQVARIAAVRTAAAAEGVPLVINARTDVWLGRGGEPAAERLAETIERSRAYLAAGADCIYPIGLADLATLRQLREATGAPLNVYASADAPSIADLETAGIARLSLGPGLLRASVTAMHRVAATLLSGGPYDAFTRDALASAEIAGWVRRPP